MIIDAEPVVRTIIASILESDGYEDARQSDIRNHKRRCMGSEDFMTVMGLSVCLTQHISWWRSGIAEA